MRILLTGARGFIGSHLRARLIAAGHEVIGTTRPPMASAESDGCLVLDPAKVPERLLEGFDALVHTADPTPARVGREPGRTWEDGVLLSKNLALAVSKSPVRTVIHLSSVAALGGPDTLSRAALDDTLVATPESDYGRHKARCEELFRALATPDRLIVTLRPPLVYGPGAGGAWAQLLGLVRSALPLPFASVNNRRSFLGVDNLGDLVVAILAHHGQGNRSGSYLAADREVVSLREICTALRQSLGKHPGLLPFPPALLAAALRCLGKKEAAAGLFGDLVIDASRVEAVFSSPPSLATLAGMARSLTNPPSPDPTR